MRRNRTEFRQFGRCKFGGPRRFLYLGRKEFVYCERHGYERNQSRNDRRREPIAIGEVNIGVFGDEIGDYQVAGLPRDENRTDNNIALIEKIHQKRAQTFLGAVVGMRIVSEGDALRDGQYYAARACAV